MRRSIAAADRRSSATSDSATRYGTSLRTPLRTARRTITNPPRVKVETAIRQTEGAIGFYTRELFTLAGAGPPAPTSR